ncbi:transglutaminase domain-containing protein [Tenacibaculum amylolyticum]|uniref:transglutaminase domain-containing protein n=1 Tax=Tenacibaculum amylolyticum TaxID=104269 RepID=UPI003894BC8A
MRLSILIFFTVFIAVAQDFSGIESKVEGYPGLLTADKLATTIKKDFPKKEDQVKALYRWLTKNIRYDLEEFYNPNRQTKTRFRYRTPEEREQKLQEIRDKTVSETLSKRRAVCEGYARTFAKVSDLMGIENEVIEGYVRNSSNSIGNPRKQPNHAWNAVKLNGKWIYIDATWGAGSESNGKWIRRFNPYYYNIPATKYFKTHLPEKSIWRLRVGRIEKEDFYKQPIYSHDFLKSNVNLVSPKSGIVKRNAKGAIKMVLTNAADKEILIGFLGSSIAQRPSVVTKGKNTTVTISPPPNANVCFLLIDREVAIEFLIN